MDISNQWNSLINSQSFKTRFLATLFVNIGRVGLSFIAGLIIARGLGPAGYGNFNFLLVSFASITIMFQVKLDKIQKKRC